ncbi:hypothetical protein OIE62_06155 [Streptomyces scopuliridis]|uniref:Uncharacterized protein n=1 Tax=Streptomyces scopuliridis TaxID=452529 RepID=A0ACD4ZZ34_9ACTN|nr:hypothetical protein [Streptomyces scopuliridis]WSB38873.1 hypothetical protein OG949_33010 [Streptomyces scopuliridis]WSC03332.1 hypothetical protein OG835_35670 [Streptomyces scopuliridis]WSC10792.1 hypothetical protein OIE62_06155 [Streptomyces scopuliridis]
MDAPTSGSLLIVSHGIADFLNPGQARKSPGRTGRGASPCARAPARRWSGSSREPISWTPARPSPPQRVSRSRRALAMSAGASSAMKWP